MATTGQAALMTTEELLALPNDGLDRELMRGELRERPMTVRNRFHSLIVANLIWSLNAWSRTQAEPRGAVYGGEVGCILRRDPDTTVGIDVAYLSAAQVAVQGNRTTLLEGRRRPGERRIARLDHQSISADGDGLSTRRAARFVQCDPRIDRRAAPARLSRPGRRILPLRDRRLG
jgi:hypothetical protein